ncbi:MAG: amidohydrolase family protein [candidate division NC10 bacterium]
MPTLIAPYQIGAHGVAAGIPEFMVRKSQAVMPAHVASFQLAVKAGVPVAAGTDAGTPLNPHGSIVPELELMVKHGMTPLDAIRSATAVAANVLGLGAEVGQVAPGFAADLVAVGGNPLERIEALADIRLVIANGKTIVNRLAERRPS